MKLNKQLTKNLAHAANVINTVGGGMVYPTFETTKEENHYRVEIKMPSVEVNNLKVEVNNNHLMIFHYMNIDEVRIPGLIGMLKISADVILDSISAEYHDGLLIVVMPYSEMFGGFNREINILKH